MRRLLIGLSVVLALCMFALAAPAQGVAPKSRATVPPTNTQPYHPEIALLPTFVCPLPVRQRFQDSAGMWWNVYMEPEC